MDDFMGAIYKEEQGIMQVRWIVMLLLFMVAISIGIVGWGSYQQLIIGKPWGNKPLSDTGLIFIDIFVLLVGVVLPLLVLKITMLTVVDREAVRVRYKFLKKKDIPLGDITSWESVEYRPIRDYGGWGIRYSITKKSWCYNVGGNRGVMLHLKDGGKLLLGSQRPDELVTAIDSVKGA